MEAFVKRRIFYNKHIFLEKTLPKEGEILVKSGDKVLPFNVLGHTYLSLSSRDVKLPPGTKIMVADGEKVSFDQVLAVKKKFFGKEEVRSPFSGIVQLKPDGVVAVHSPAERFNLVSGIEAKVVKVCDKISVLLETDAVIVRGVFAQGCESVGEVKLIENGSDVLKTKELSADDLGKILVFPGFVPGPVLQKAKTVGVAGIVCGSLESVAGVYPTNILATEGFGPAMMPQSLRNFFSALSVKTAVISPERLSLIIPGLSGEKFPQDEGEAGPVPLKPGASVQILSWPYFGQEAQVVGILGPHTFESGITAEAVSLKLAQTSEKAIMAVANILILE